MGRWRDEDDRRRREGFGFQPERSFDHPTDEDLPAGTPAWAIGLSSLREPNGFVRSSGPRISTSTATSCVSYPSVFC
jgi:hypothetical protein